MSVNNRILVVDDTPSVHEDFRKILPSSDCMSKVLPQMALSLTRRASSTKKQRIHLMALQQNLDNCYPGVDQFKQ